MSFYTNKSLVLFSCRRFITNEIVENVIARIVDAAIETEIHKPYVQCTVRSAAAPSLFPMMTLTYPSIHSGNKPNMMAITTQQPTTTARFFQRKKQTSDKTIPM